MSSHYVPASCDFLYGHLPIGRANLFRGCEEIVWKSCNAGAISTESAWKLYGTRAGSIQRLHGDGVVTV